MFQDYLFFGTDLESRYLYRMAHLSSLVQYAQNLHKLSPGRACALGEVFLGCNLISSILENEERFNLRIRHRNEFLISAETTKFAEIKGFIECEEGTEGVAGLDSGKVSTMDLHVRTLRVIPDVNKVTEGNTALVTSSFEEAINDHLQKSYQMASRVWLRSWIDKKDMKPRAFGAIFMELPRIDSQVREELWAHVDGLPTPDALFAQSDDPDVLAAKLIPHTTLPVRSLTPKWFCTCSRGAVEEMLMKLPHSEILDMLTKAEPVEVKCHYCNQAYVVSSERIGELSASAQLLARDPGFGAKN